MFRILIQLHISDESMHRRSVVYDVIYADTINSNPIGFNLHEEFPNGQNLLHYAAFEKDPYGKFPYYFLPISACFIFNIL